MVSSIHTRNLAGRRLVCRAYWWRGCVVCADCDLSVFGCLPLPSPTVPTSSPRSSKRRALPDSRSSFTCWWTPSTRLKTNRIILGNCLKVFDNVFSNTAMWGGTSVSLDTLSSLQQASDLDLSLDTQGTLHHARREWWGNLGIWLHTRGQWQWVQNEFCIEWQWAALHKRRDSVPRWPWTCFCGWCWSSGMRTTLACPLPVVTVIDPPPVGALHL